MNQHANLSWEMVSANQRRSVDVAQTRCTARCADVTDSDAGQPVQMIKGYWIG